MMDCEGRGGNDFWGWFVLTSRHFWLWDRLNVLVHLCVPCIAPLSQPLPLPPPPQTNFPCHHVDFFDLPHSPGAFTPNAPLSPGYCPLLFLWFVVHQAGVRGALGSLVGVFEVRPDPACCARTLNPLPFSNRPRTLAQPLMLVVVFSPASHHVR